MDHSVALISTLAAAFGLALPLGFLAVRLKLPALVGYLVAGIVVGPATPGFVADLGLARQLAEVGVMLLMFGVGLHLSVDDLLQVRRIALPGAVIQIAVASALGVGVAMLWGWSAGAGIVFGLALSVASTVVVLKTLEARGVLASVNGRIAVGWLVVQDLVMVIVLVLLPPLSGWLGGNESRGGHNLAYTLLVTLGQVALFVVLMLVVGKRVFPWILWQVARTNSRELFTLSVVAAAVGIAYGSAELFGVSFALGAFFAGLMLSESHLSQRAAEESLPLRDAFSVLFFVSVGMLFDPAVLVREPGHVLAVVGIIIFGNSLAALAIVLVFRYPLNTALTVAASLAQVGEFSFILAGPWRVARAAAARRPEPGPRGRADFDRAESAGVRRDRAAAKVDPRAFPGGARARAQRRPARRVADDGRPEVPDRAGRAGRLRPGRAAHRRSAGRARHTLRRRRREPRDRRVAARRGRAGGFRQRGRAGGADPGPHRARVDAGDRHPRHLPRAPHDRNRPRAQPGHRNGGAHAQRGRGDAPARRRTPGPYSWASTSSRSA